MGVGASHGCSKSFDCNKTVRCEGMSLMVAESTEGSAWAYSPATINQGLLNATRAGSVEKMQQWIDMGADVETRRPWVMSMFRVGLDKLPLEDVGRRCEGMTPLMLAAANGDMQACTLLLTHDACVNVVDEDGMTPLHFAATAGCYDTCRLLLALGARRDALDDEGACALHCVPREQMLQPDSRRRWEALLAPDT
mmetsp:Transcript_1841/g.3980  ORF Transcript_1841/g.3980 Transcript_1841/m.3980 type:complete len:195 (-) Transcript_1841:76-660(-)